MKKDGIIGNLRMNFDVLTLCTTLTSSPFNRFCVLLLTILPNRESMVMSMV